MKRKRLPKRDLESLCGEVHPDDGLDPSEFFESTHKRRADDRKARQLCQQVAETLSLVLSGELGDLRIVTVTPAPDISQLTVLVAPADAGVAIDAEKALADLASAAGRLRAEIASAITRRRAPKLLFQFLATADERRKP